MTIRFAAAWGRTTPAMVGVLCCSAPLSAANDNRRADATPRRWIQHRTAAEATANGRLLTEALHHFARHGLAAAARARAEAETAAAAGDDASRDRWIAICHQLDRRMADACLRNLKRQG